MDKYALAAMTNEKYEEHLAVLRNARKTQGITYRKMAEDLGIKHNTLHNYLSGKRPMKLKMLITLSLYLGIEDHYDGRQLLAAEKEEEY